MKLSIPSFRGFSLFPRNGASLAIDGKGDFQSPVLGVFLCFLTEEEPLVVEYWAFNPQF